MNNFFYNSSEYSLFRKALKDTKGEPVLINLLSTDPSLNEEIKQEEPQQPRRNQSSKFEPTTPFGKFFGARKATRTTPVDMKDFSSWKNKNYRKVEENINTESESSTKFSLSDYMNKTMGENKFNDNDQLKNETQKPINELSTDDPIYKRFSLDSYLHKLEEQSKVKDKFEKNDDLLEPLGDMTQDVVPDSSQDEDFGLSSQVNAEGFALDENISGERFAFEKSELDKVKSRLEKMEREAANIKDKPTEKVINTNELTGIAREGEPEEELMIKKVDEEDDIDIVNKKMAEGTGIIDEEIIDETEKPKVKHKTFIEINKTPETAVAREPVYDKSEDLTLDANEDLSDSNIKSESESSDGEIDEFAAILAGVDDEEELDENFDISDYEEDLEEESLAGEKKKSTDVSDEDIEDDSGDEAQDIGDFDKLVDDEDGGVITDEDGEPVLRRSTVKKTKGSYATKEDLDALSDDLLQQFSDLHKKDQPSMPYGGGTDSTQFIQQPVDDVAQVSPVGYTPEVQPVYTGAGQSYTKIINQPGVVPIPVETETIKEVETKEPYNGEPIVAGVVADGSNTHLEKRILEMIEENKKADAEAREKLKRVEDEKNKMAEEYETRLKDLEQAFKKKDEETKQKAYLDKLKSDIKLKKAESNFKLREQRIKEFEKESSEKQKIGVMLRKELKNNLNIANLEMDKKLLEVASKIKREQEEEQEEELKRARAMAIQNEPEVEEQEEEEKPVKKPAPKPKKRTTKRSHSHTRTTRRKIDSDIIGGIDFD